MDKGRPSSSTAWLFDVDGVLTSPEEKKVVLLEIFVELIKRLRKNEPVGLNTGRSLDFITSEVLNPLEKIAGDKKILKNVVGIGEKGGAWIVYDEGGKRITSVDKNISVPVEIQNKVRELIGKSKFSEKIFFDETKETMVTVEIRPGVTVKQFETIRREIDTELKRILDDYHLGDEYRVDATRIAIDIESKKIGKAYGARKFAELLKERGIDPQKYICFGDSESDFDMYEELKRMGKLAELVFVGERDVLEGKNLQEVKFTGKLLDKGTLDYLRYG